MITIDQPVDSLTPVSKTAFYCCGARMKDAEQDHPVCDDRYAKVFMDDAAMDIYNVFSDEAGCTITMLARHRIIDDILRAALITRPELCIVTIGAGLDTRPYRIDGGTWIELDAPELLAYKNEKLPVSECKNSLHRVAIDFSAESLQEKLSAFARYDHVMFVVEGVMLYLTEQEIKEMLGSLESIFPQHSLICDLITRDTIAMFGKSLTDKLNGIGASFKAVENPRAVMLEDGYSLNQTVSIVEKAVDFLDLTAMRKMMLKYSLMWVLHGNSVYVFGK